MTDANRQPFGLEESPLWYKDAVIYEVHVRAFHDSDGDGIGDFRGLIEKLDYLQDLGVNVLWLLPFYPSPLKDDGYDISDYTQVHPNYGTLQDFRAFLREASRRGLRVITELVLNHTSDQHQWFQRARQAEPGSRYRDYYVWSDAPEKYREARIIFKDFESSNWTWDPVARAYYWHRFFSHQPDLNFESPSVRQAMLRVVDFYLNLGVSGLRLDAVPYLYEREGTNCENLPESHAFLKELRRHVDERFQNRMLLAEANQWPEDAVAYFGNGDECHMAFHFPIMPRLFMAVRMEDRFPILDILQQTPPIPENCQWALFIRNHDELTLEMVTDEERDYMYRLYAHERQSRINLGIRRRLAPLLNNDRKKIELMNGLLFSLPGAPVLYYGDEIGMGDNFYLGDRNGVRTPMQWSSDKNAGFSRANPQKLYLPIIINPEYHYEAINVETQQSNPESLLWWMKRLIALRKHHKAFAHGSLEFLYPDNHKVLAFLRRYGDETILAVANLSRLAQHAYLDLSGFVGRVPVEVFGRSEFPPIGVGRYLITLGPHAFYWFSLEPQRLNLVSLYAAPAAAPIPTLAVKGEWGDLFKGAAQGVLGKVLVGYVKGCRWFGGKARQIQSAGILDVIPMHYAVGAHPQVTYLVLLQVQYAEGEPETYCLPLTFASGKQAEQINEVSPHAVVAHLKLTDRDQSADGILCDALVERDFCKALLEAINHHRHFRGHNGEVVATSTQAFRQLRRPEKVNPSTESRQPPSTGSWLCLEPAAVKVEQSNTSVVYGDRLILKVFRRLDDGINPELELGRFLTETVPFPHLPPVMGALEYRRRREEAPITVGILQGYIHNQGDAWRYSLDQLGHYFERVLTQTAAQEPPLPGKSLLALSQETTPILAQETIGPYLAAASLLGRRTAELHLALAADYSDPDFAPEPFSELYQRSLYQSMRNLTGQVFELLGEHINKPSTGTGEPLPEGASQEAQRVLGLESQIVERFRALRQQPINALRTRFHGDYHLGQVLYTGNDFVIIDFEGEPARPLTERRIKRSPLRDVAGMVRSFHYVSQASLSGKASTVIRGQDLPLLEKWARFWYLWVSATFLKTYLATVAEGGRAAEHPSLLPEGQEELKVMLDAFLLEKAVYEIGYELNHRPDWVRVPLQGILQLLEAEE